MADPLESREFLDVVLRSIADGVFAVDRSLKIIYFNRSAERITGWTREDAMGQPYEEVFRVDSSDGLDPLKAALDMGDVTIDFEEDILTRSGQRVTVSISASLLLDENCNFLGAVETFRDVSHFKELLKEQKGHYTFQDIVSKNARMREIMDILPDIAASDSTVLIQGESGTGKGLVARAIHNSGARKVQPFVKVNCGALPETLLESELFGYVKGAFTGANRDRDGRFEAAQDGTIFIDEVGDVSPAVQLKLLRVLQEREYEPLGSNDTRTSTARVITATNKNLEKMAHRGQFREDLFYRLNVIPIDLPPLRDRPDDVPLLVSHFIEKFNRKTGRRVRSLSREAMRIVMNHPFPGNVRQLENIIEHAFVLAKGTIIDVSALPQSLRDSGGGGRRRVPRNDEHRKILAALAEHGGNQVRAARALGMHRITLWRKLKALEEKV